MNLDVDYKRWTQLTCFLLGCLYALRECKENYTIILFILCIHFVFAVHLVEIQVYITQLIFKVVLVDHFCNVLALM